MSPILATWANGFFTLGLLAVAYGAACAISAGLTWCTRQIYCGRRACAWCKKDLGRAPGLPHGKVTHTICPTCNAAMFANLNLTGDSSRKDGNAVRSFGVNRVRTAEAVSTASPRS